MFHWLISEAAECVKYFTSSTWTCCGVKTGLFIHSFPKTANDFHPATAICFTNLLQLCVTETHAAPLKLILGNISQALLVHRHSETLTSPSLSPAGYVGMQLVPKTTRNPHQIGGVVLRLRAWAGAGCVWGWATGEEGQTPGPVPVPLPGSLRGLDTSVRQKQTSRRTPAEAGVPR